MNKSPNLNIAILAALLSSFFIIQSWAQNGISDEIVVTGSRIRAYEDESIPIIHIKKRADFFIFEVSVESDSRDKKLRNNEVLQTLKSIESRAKKVNQIELGVLRTLEYDDDEIEFVTPFSADLINENIFFSGRRADTTRTNLIIKSPISKDDTVDDIKQRVDNFIKSVRLSGRASIINDDEPGLSIVNITQYRTPLLKAVAADNEDIKTIFGDGYKVKVSGLEKAVRWRIIGPLDIALYFPYESVASPNP